MKCLQVLLNGEWQYVFCVSETKEIVTTDKPSKALKNAIGYFSSKFANRQFREV